MRTRCPSCGATLSLDALVAHEGAREALAAAFKLSGTLGAALVRYVALHRPDSRELTMERVRNAKTAKPGAAQPSGSGTARALKDATSRLRKTGSDADAIAAFSALGI